MCFGRKWRLMYVSGIVCLRLQTLFFLIECYSSKTVIYFLNNIYVRSNCSIKVMIYFNVVVKVMFIAPPMAHVRYLTSIGSERATRRMSTEINRFDRIFAKCFCWHQNATTFSGFTFKNYVHFYTDLKIYAYI